MELIAVLGRTPDGGRMHVGRIIECAWRLPSVYASVIAGRIPPYKAHRIADQTRSLTPDAAAFVDRQLAAVGNVGWAQLDRLITEAIIRFDPERAEAERQKAQEHRFCEVSEVDEHGNALITAVVDVADGHDFNTAIAREAEVRGRLGDEGSLDARRAQAVGAIARRDLALDLLTTDETTGEVTVRSAGRKVVMDLHITDTTLTGENPVGRWGDKPVTTAQIKQWLRSRETTSIIVRPVINLADCVPVDSYEIPDRHKHRVRSRRHTCSFPNCTTPAVKCDIDHEIPHRKGGPTCPCNLHPLCRRHHRAKTFSEWRYLSLAPGHFLWTSPHGRLFLVGPGGTRALDPPRVIDH
ncbi:hypothetical protein ASE01_06980 [Nocardioides sp. Root190]|uniref:HNH endonuclease signature motif containing protein n=1 Tax=Nocardioides sp. Root190 TaxID=1736488 RepID=UPI0006F6A39B|nr:HNH endonuclease signature motif containing protein [Nocardioides sp. Root190]KRB77918.1 hypothetical protein ASE01_06980 [Nocardioides sp. Root190]